MRKAISLFLVFSMLFLLGSMYAEGRKGADMIIQRIDGTQVRGELIAVKNNSLVLIERELGADVTVDIDDIFGIAIVKKSKALLGVGFGVLIGGISGALIGATIPDKKGLSFPDKQLVTILYSTLVSVIGAMIGGGLGGTLGAGAGKDEIIQIERRSESEIREILEKLRKKARVRNAQ